MLPVLALHERTHAPDATLVVPYLVPEGVGTALAVELDVRVKLFSLDGVVVLLLDGKGHRVIGVDGGVGLSQVALCPCSAVALGAYLEHLGALCVRADRGLAKEGVGPGLALAPPLALAHICLVYVRGELLGYTERVGGSGAHFLERARGQVMDLFVSGSYRSLDGILLLACKVFPVSGPGEYRLQLPLQAGAYVVGGLGRAEAAHVAGCARGCADMFREPFFSVPVIILAHRGNEVSVFALLVYLALWVVRAQVALPAGLGLSGLREAEVMARVASGAGAHASVGVKAAHAVIGPVDECSVLGHLDDRAVAVQAPGLRALAREIRLVVCGLSGGDRAVDLLAVHHLIGAHGEEAALVVEAVPELCDRLCVAGVAVVGRYYGRDEESVVVAARRVLL